MGKENDGPEGRDHEYCGQDWLRSFWLAPIEDIVGKLLGGEIGEAGFERGGKYQARGSDREERAHCCSSRRGEEW